MKMDSFSAKGTAAQYDGFAAGEIGASVNLFHGEATFEYPLVEGIPARNGVGIKITATYSSNTDKSARADNRTEPTGVMGLGWQFGYPAILRADSDRILPPEEEIFYYRSGGGLARLYQIDQPWLAAVLPGEIGEELDQATISDTLAQMFADAGVVVTAGSQLKLSTDETTQGKVYLIVDQQEEQEFRLLENPDGDFALYYSGVLFEASNYDFSRIVYFPQFEKWLITQKNGIRNIFGGLRSVQALEYVVCYHGGLFPSGNQKGQQVVRQWNLSQELSLWDDSVTYEYQQICLPVGQAGLSFTRECYLASVRDSSGFSVALHYGKKAYTPTCKEYLDPLNPYTTPSDTEADCRQSRFETCFLESLEVFSPSGEQKEQIIFDYDVITLHGDVAIPGSGAKRLLRRIRKQYPSGGQVPDAEFTYNQGLDVNLGALSGVLTPAGAKVSYQYTQKQLAQCCSRKQQISKESYSDRQVWSGEDFAAVLLYNQQASLLRLYSWIGRFQSWTPPEQPFGQLEQEVQAIVLENGIVLYTTYAAQDKTRVVWYRQDPDILGGFTTELSEEFPSAFCSVAAGTDWVTICERDIGRVSRFTYDLLHRQTVSDTLEGTPETFYAVTANGTRYVLMEYDRSGQAGQKQTHIHIEARLNGKQWQTITEIPLPDLTAIEDELDHSVKLSVACSGTLCAAAFVSSTEQHAFYYDLRVWQLPQTSQEAATELFRKSYAVNGGLSIWNAPSIAWEPVIFGQFILTCGSVLAYDGARIYENTKLDTSNFTFAEGYCAQAIGRQDFIQSRALDGQRKSVLVQALRYDPAHPEKFSNQEPVCIKQETPEELKENGYSPTICGDIAVVEQQVYDLQKDQPFAYPIAQLDTQASAAVVNGGNFVAYPSDSGDAYSVRIVNGKVQEAEPLEGSLPETQNGVEVFFTENEHSLFLYVNTGDCFYQPISNAQIYQILSDDGTAVTGKCYTYDDDSAVCDSSGRFVKYYTVDVYPEAAKSNGFTRYQYCNSIAGTQPYENMTTPYAMDGQLHATSVYDGAGNQQSHTVFSYDMTRSIAEVPEGERTRAIYGAVLQASSSRLEQDGVTTETTVEYDPFTGETAAVTNLVHNVFGDKIQTVERTYAAAMVEPAFIWQNRLTEKVKTLTEWRKNEEEVKIAQARAVGFRTYTGKKRSILAGCEAFQWTGIGDPYDMFPQEQADRKKLEESWEQVQKIAAYDQFGNVIGQEAPIGISETTHYSKDGFFCIGHVTSPMDHTSMICTFEAYESIPDPWVPFVTEEMAIAGRRSLKLAPGQETEALTVSLAPQEYGIAFWGTEQITLTVEGRSVSVLENLSQEKKVGIYQITRFNVQENAQVQISFQNTSSENVYLDLFSLFPFAHPPMIQVYRDHLLAATVNGYGFFAQYIYDRRNNQIGTESDTSCASWTIPFYDRLSQFGQGAYGLNAELILTCKGESFYRPVVSAGEEITLPDSDETSMDCAVYVDVRGEAEVKLQLGAVSVCYCDGEWILSNGEETSRMAGNGGDGEWLLLAGKKVLFFFNGEYVCGIRHSCCEPAETLSLSGQAVFSKLLYGQQVTFGIRYLDAMGRVRQGQMFDGNTVTVTQNFYDSENHLIAQTKPAEFNDLAFGYLEDFAALDLETGIMSGRIADAYPEDEGFPYVSQRFETTPVGRMLESGLPGKAYAIDPSVEEQNRQTSRISYEKLEIPGLNLPDGYYHYTVTTSPNGNRSVSVLNEQNQQVAVAALGDNQAIVSASVIEYGNGGHTETQYLPGYFAGNPNSVRVKTVDYRGNLISLREPNQEGETRYCYDELQQQRFMQTPVMLKGGYFLYQKYNEMQQVTEEGFCYDAWEDAVLHVQDAAYPTQNLIMQRRYTYGDTLHEVTALFQIKTVEIFDETGELEAVETYGYDEADRIISKSIRIVALGKEYAEHCSYDRAGDLLSTTNSAGWEMRYRYDANGRRTEEVRGDGTKIAEFQYNPTDEVCAMRTNGGLAEYAYTNTGWIQQIRSPLMEETIAYQGTRISEFQIDLKTESVNVPASIRYVVEYDDFGRLASALCYDGDQLLEEISIKSISYDVNGNILHMETGQGLRDYLYQEGKDRLQSVTLPGQNTVEFAYDADGAVTAAGDRIQEIRYANGRPVLFRTANGTFSVTYDSAGNRLQKIAADGSRKVYLYTNRGRLSEEISVADGTVRQYLYGQFGMRAVVEQDAVLDVYTDHLGSLRSLGRNGKLEAAAQYTPFGEQISLTGEMPAGFNGYRIDPETGVYYSAYRLYDPEIGRFYSCDPKAGAESPYVFCGNDPLNHIDPQGDSWWGTLLGVIVGIVGIAATVATAGLCLPAAMASETALVTEAVVGTVAGTVGSLAGTLTTAACDKQPITGKMVAGALVGGAVSGLGAFAGPLGQMSMRAAMAAGKSVGAITAVGFTVGCTVGAAAGVSGSLAASAVTGTPVSGVSIAMAGLAGMGTGLLATRAAYGVAHMHGTSFLPVMIQDTEQGLIRNGNTALNEVLTEDRYGIWAQRYPNQNVRTVFNDCFGSDQFFSFIDDETFANIGDDMLSLAISPFKVGSNTVNAELINRQASKAAVIAAHGFGRHCFVICRYGRQLVYRPIAGSKFVNYFAQNYALDSDTSYLKLLICFAGCAPGCSSTAQKFATRMNVTTFATRGIAYPESETQKYLQFG